MCIYIYTLYLSWFSMGDEPTAIGPVYSFINNEIMCVIFVYD